MKSRKYRYLSVATVMSLLLSLMTVFAISAPAQAASMSGFVAGNIIDDALFFDGNAMTATDVQNFLNAQLPTCTINNGDPSHAAGAPYGTTRIADVCLKSYSQTTVNIAAQYDDNGNLACNAYTGAANETAAQIITKVGQACGISQRVLLVLLQKEQGLITDSWPTVMQYQKAMGANCPDTAPCSAATASFFKQVRTSAFQFKNYGTGSFTWYPVGGTRDIQFSPDASCGTRSVTIANRATAALYYYTPYTPNDALMADNPDSCSAYGNANFYKYYTDWFGSVHGSGMTAIYGRTSDGKLYLYRGDGRGSWLPTVQVGNGWQIMRAIVNVGDFNSDGKRDLLTLDTSGVVRLYPTDGNTGWGATSQVATGWNPNVHLVAPGDFDENGKADLLTIDPAGDMWLNKGNGASGFLSSTKISSGWNDYSAAFGAGDWNGDKHQDVIARQNNGDLWLFPGTGAGAFSPRQKIGNGWGSFTSIFMVDDFDGDRVKDLIARSSTGQLILYRGNGAGGFISGSTQIGTGWNMFDALVGRGFTTMYVAPTPTPTPTPTSTASRTPTPTPTPSGSTAPVGSDVKVVGAGDINSDTKRDVLAMTSTGGVLLYPGNGAGGWLASKSLVSALGASQVIASVGDLNSDGVNDLVWKDSSNNLQRAAISNSGLVGTVTQIATGLTNVNLLLGPGDFDGDGKRDVLARDTAGALWLYPGDGAGGLSPRRQVGNGWAGMTAVLAAGKFNSDNFTDVLSRDSAGGFWLYPGNGSGGWLTPVKVGIGWGIFNSIFSPGDFSGDGKTDVLARDATGRLFLYTGSGSGGWIASKQIGIGWGPFTWVG